MNEKVEVISSIFDDLFLSDLEVLEIKFILSSDDMLWKLETSMLQSLDDFNSAKICFFNYKNWLRKNKEAKQ